LYLKEITVPIPFEQGSIVVRNEKRVEFEIARSYSSEIKNNRVKRCTIGKIDPFFPGRMFPNEKYFELIENDVPEEVRDAFLRKCERRREIAALKKDPEAMMREVANGLKILKEKGMETRNKIYAEQENIERNNEGEGDESMANNNESNEKVWFISDERDLDYLMRVFRDLYDMMEGYAEKNPGGVVDEFKVEMFNSILEDLKGVLPDHQIIQCLDLLQKPEWKEDEDGDVVLVGATNSDAMMLLAWYKNALGTL